MENKGLNYKPEKTAQCLYTNIYRIAYDGKKVRIEEHHAKIKTTKLFYRNRFNVTILSCMNI